MGDGLYISDDWTLNSTGLIGDCNAGYASNVDARLNGGNGVHVKNVMRSTIASALVEINTGWGHYLAAESQDIIIFGGDTDESNTAGNVYNAGDYNRLMGIQNQAVTDVGTYTTILRSTRAIFPILEGSISVNTPIVVANGMTFPAVQVPSSDPNTLDDYEEGIWTPGLSGTSVTSSAGQYIKIGRTVFLSGTITVNAGAANVGSINGFPFQVFLATYGAPTGTAVTSSISWNLLAAADGYSASLRKYDGSFGCCWRRSF